jgi:hypothetical protein
MEKSLIVLIILQLLLFSNALSVHGELPVIASRVSVITEISVILYSGDIHPNKTLFSIDVVVEILNRDDEDQTVIDLDDCYPKAYINASFANQSLVIEPIGLCLNEGMFYNYRPGITREYETTEFYINQSSLTQLPDGNYSLLRPINTASKLGYVDPAEILLTNITVTSGTMNFSYPYFEIYSIPEISTELTITLAVAFLLSCAILVVRRRRTTID